MARMLGTALKARVAVQSAFATPAAGPYTPVHTYSRGDQSCPPQNDDPLLGDTRYNARDPVAPSIGRQPGTAKRTVPLCLSEVGFWFTACLGAATVTGTDDYTHVFHSGSETPVFLTVQDLLGGTMFRTLHGVYVNGFTLSAKKDDDYPRLDLDLLLHDEATAAAWISGTPNAALTLLRPRGWHCTAKWNDVAIGNALESQLNYSNNAQRYDVLDGGEFAATIDPMLAALGGSLKLRTSSETYFALAAAGGDPGKLSLIWAMPASPTTQLLQIDYNMVRLTTEGQPVQGAGELTSDFSLRGEQNANGPALTMTLKNQVADYA